MDNSFGGLHQGDGCEAVHLEVVFQRLQEYLNDRMSVPPECREQFDAIEPILRNIGEAIKPQGSIKPKDDEAFRFFLDDPDVKL